MSSTHIYEIDEGLWQLYLVDCQMNELAPGISDFLVWCEDNDYDRPEVYDGEFGVQDEN